MTGPGPSGPLDVNARMRTFGHPGVATAGHIDHGKSSLVLALTGTDPDRLRRGEAAGLTIDLGFAFTTLTPGVESAFVDVPGHVRFLKNMLAGVGGVDVAPARRRRHRGLDAPVGGAPAHPRSPRRRPRHRRDHQGRPGRRRDRRDRRAGDPRPSGGDVARGRPRGGVRLEDRTGHRRRARRARAPCWPGRPRPGTLAGPACGSTGSSRRRAQGPW